MAKQDLVFSGIKEANFCWEVLRFPAALLLASFFGRSMNFLVLYSETAFPRKLYLKSEFAQLQTSSILFNFIIFNLANVGEIFSVESERTVSKFRKGERQFLCCVHLLHKASL